MNTEHRSQRRKAAESLKEAEAVCDDLCVALESAGITLPSLCVEPMAYADEMPQPLVELGRCTVQTARSMTAAILKGQE